MIVEDLYSHILFHGGSFAVKYRNESDRNVSCQILRIPVIASHVQFFLFTVRTFRFAFVSIFFSEFTILEEMNGGDQKTVPYPMGKEAHCMTHS